MVNDKNLHERNIVNSGRFTPAKNSIKDIVKEFNFWCGKVYPGIKKTKKLALAFDVFKEYCVSGAWVNNYFYYEFYNKDRTERNKYLTWRKAIRLIIETNGRKASSMFIEKNTFNITFSNYIKRDWLFMKDATEDEFIEFCSKHETFIQKPQDERNGNGVIKVSINSTGGGYLSILCR